MSKIQAQILKGFRDYLPQDMIPREEMINKVKQVFQSYGYSPLETPALEYQETLLGKYGTEGEKQLYKFEDNGQRKVGLRFDLTVPLARVMATSQNDISLPFKRYQIQNVYRAEKPQKGRYREFYQCDADCVGATSLVADAEYVLIACDLLKVLGVKDFQVRLNNRKILNGFFEYAGIKEKDVRAVFGVIDKKSKLTAFEFKKDLQAIGLSEDQIKKIISFSEISGTNQEILAELNKIFIKTPAGQPGVAELAEVVSYLQAAKLPEKNYQIDLSIARGLEYYTGTVYETFLGGAASSFGSVLSGGRYDKLIGMFLKQDIPAIGCSLGLDRLYAALVELGLVDNKIQTTAEILITVFDESLKAKSFAVADKLRRAGKKVSLYPGDGNLGKQFKYADKLGIRYAIVVGPEEVEQNKATVKDLLKNKQITVSIDQLDQELGL